MPRIASQGERNGASKLTEDAVRSIRNRYIPGTGNCHGPNRGNASKLAAEYGINRRTVLSIVDGTTWGWVE